MLFKEKETEKILIKIVIFLIKLYQKTLSFDHGPFRYIRPYGTCRFYPTCSQYTIDAINKKGLFKGLWFGFNRLKKCHPLSKGGYDPFN